MDLKLNKIRKRVAENYKAGFEYNDAVRDEILRRCNNLESGARLIDAVVNNELLPEISAEFLRKTMDGRVLKKISFDAKDGKFIYNFE